MSKVISSPSWLETNARWLMGAIALLGMIETTVLTIVEFLGKTTAICPANGCHQVLDSPYAWIFGIPLPLFGLLAYTSVSAIALIPSIIKLKFNKNQGLAWEDATTTWLLVITTAMTVASSYLMYIMFFKLEGICFYCIASALFSLTLFILSLIINAGEGLDQILFTSIVAGIITITSVVGVYAPIQSANATAPGVAPTITQTSGTAEIALAQQLKKVNAKIYTSYTCPHCYEQKQLFGKEAFSLISNIECHPEGQNAKPELCKKAGITGVPAWEIDGKFYSGVQSLEQLADIAGYQGDRHFIYPFPY